MQLGVSVRHLQQKCKFSQLQTDCVTKMMRKKGSGKSDLRGADRKLQLQAGVKRVVLHGYSKVHDNGDYCQHVYGPQDHRDSCPKCGHPRYKAMNSKQPNEKVYWFPLIPRLEALLKLENYRRLLQVICPACEI